MADETLRFDIIGNDRLSGPLTEAGAAADKMSRNMDAAARSAAILDEALKRQQSAARTSVDATLALARADKILEEAEHGLTAGALEAEFALKKQADAAKRSGDAARKAAADNAGLAASLQKIADDAKKGGPSGLIGAGVGLLPAVGTLGGVAGGAAIGLTGAFTAAAGALAAFGAVAKPVLSDALTAAQAVNTAQNNYQATLAAGVPKAQAQLALQTANAQALLTYNAALAGGAKPAAALAAYHLALAHNQVTYNAAVNTGTFQAKAYQAEQLAIQKAYADLSPQQIALSQQLGAMANAWDDLKAAQTPVVAGALQPWLKSVTDLTGQLGPIIRTVSPVIRELGVSFDALINSPQFIKFRDFIANTGSAAVGAVGGTLIDLIDAFIVLLPKFNPLIEKTVGWLGGLGPAVLSWSASQKTADGITKFMAWFNTNGPVVGGLLTNIGGALKNLLPGLTAGGAIELKIISDFFAWVAKLPKGIAGPLAETAGALLLLNKLGVFSVGVKFIGPAAKWLSGGLIDIGGAEAAGAEAGATIRAAMVSGGAAAAAEIRAAMGTGGAVAGAEGAAGAGGATLKSGLSGVLAGAAAAAGPVAAGALIGAMLRALGNALSPSGTFAGSLNRMFQNLSGPISSSVLHAFTFGGLEAWVTAKIGLPVGAALLATGKFIQNQWATIWANTIGGATNDGKRLVAVVASTWTTVAAGAKQWWGNITTTVTGSWGNLLGGAKTWGTSMAGSIAATWNTIWTSTRNAVTTGVAAVVTFFTGLPGKIRTGLGVAATVLSGWGSGVISGLLTGMQSVIGSVWTFIKSIPGQILSFLGIKSPPQWAIDAGKHIMNGIGIGMTQAKGALAKATSVVSGFLGAGSASYAADITAVLKSMGLPLTLVANWLRQIQTESGGNLTAVNRTDSNAAAGHPSVGLLQLIPSTFAAYAGPYRNTPPLVNEGGGPVSLNPMAQIYAAIHYAAARYGGAAMASVIGQGHGYALGTSSALPGWALVGERGPEMVRFRGGEQVIPARSPDQLAAKLDQLIAAVGQLTGVAAAIPARTGQHVGAAIDGAAHSASIGRRYR